MGLISQMLLFFLVTFDTMRDLVEIPPLFLVAKATKGLEMTALKDFRREVLPVIMLLSGATLQPPTCGAFILGVL